MSNISRERVYGCFFGQLVGDALGSRYEFGNSKDTIIKIYRDIDNNCKKSCEIAHRRRAVVFFGA